VIYKKPKRHVNRTFIHCSDSDHDHHDDISVIRKWHVEERGWADVGYHFFIKKDGTIQKGRPIESQPAAQKNNNYMTIAICLSGEEHFTHSQKRALSRLCEEINSAHKDMTFHGHCEVDKGKTCPNFNYKKTLGLDLNGRIPPLVVEDSFSDWLVKDEVPDVFIAPRKKSFCQTVKEKFKRGVNE
jgi:N-acetylmuramoyl-L-alanine amidase